MKGLLVEMETGSFAEACYDMNSIEELEAALAGKPDPADMAEWGLTEQAWKAQIAAALAVKKQDLAG